MTYLLDTNVAIRALLASSQNKVKPTLDSLAREGIQLVVCPQVVYEAWVVLTRPLDANGVGMNPQEVCELLQELLSVYPCKSDPPELLQLWLELCRSKEVSGKQAHDVRLVAFCLAQSFDGLVTFNPDDFKRFPEIKTIGFAN